MRYKLFPKLKFYIMERLYQPGELADFSIVSDEGAELDFTDGDGKGMNHASVTQKNNGGWDIRYSKVKGPEWGGNFFCQTIQTALDGHSFCCDSLYSTSDSASLGQPMGLARWEHVTWILRIK